MKRINDVDLLNFYINQHKINDIFDQQILDYAQLHYYQKDEMILKAEDRLNYYYLLVNGKIKVSYLFENGKSMLMKFYQEFNSIGDVELLKDVPILCNIESITEAYLIAIPADVLRNQFMDNLKFLHHLIRCLSEKLYVTVNNSSYNLIYPLINRLASYLMELKGEGNEVILSATYTEVAEFLGTSYRHLNRIMKELEDKSIISIHKKKIRILD